MPRQNYQHERRQRDLARQKKQEEKRLRKAQRAREGKGEGGEPAPSAEEPTTQS